MFAVIYDGAGPDGWPPFTDAVGVWAKVFEGYGIALYYKGKPPKTPYAEKYGKVLSIQLVDEDLKVKLPDWVNTN